MSASRTDLQRVRKASPKRTGARVANVTIVDVAHAAGVSIKTVSRVLNREPNVSTATREQVMAAAAALHYTPNVSARSLAGSRSYLIALLYDNPNAAYIADLQTGALSRCRAGGYHLIIEPFDTTAADAPDAIADMMSKLRTDGMILTPPLCDHPGVLELLDTTGAAYVRIAPSNRVDHGSVVRIDDMAAAREMTRLLIADGHRDIGFVKGHPDHGASHQRLAGFLAAMTEAGLTVRPDWIAEGLFSFLSGVAAGTRLLDRNDRPTAIFACNDDTALGVMSEANRLGLVMPRDLSVAGFDDTPTARVVWPQLTTVRQPVADMAAMAADMIIEGRTEDEAESQLMAFEIIVRGSTGPAPRAALRD